MPDDNETHEDTHDALETMRQEASEQEEAKQEDHDSLTTLSDQDLRIRIGQLKTADRQEDLLVRQGESLDNSLRHFELKHTQAKAIVDGYIATEANAIVRSRANMPRWRTNAHFHDALKWLENADAILDAIQAHQHPPTQAEHDALSTSRKQKMDAWEAELERRQLQREAEEAEKEAARAAEIEAQRKAALD